MCANQIAENACFKGATILVVDDSPDNRLLAAKILEKHEAKVVLARSGEEAINTLRQGFLPDLILLDIMMPGIDGFTVLKVLKAHSETKEIPVVVLTALDREASESRSVELGAVEVLTKPISAATLIGRVAAYVPHTP